MLSSGEAAARLARTYAKVTWRIMPLIIISYLVSYIDRVNVGFAKLQMSADIQLSDAAYGFGAGIFFIGYFLFEVPSNLLLHRIGARFWISRIMVTWGLISAAMAFTAPLGRLFGVSSETSFYTLRFLLGAAEAGFFPGIILYLTYWYPAHRQSRILALLLVAQPVAFILGAPLSGAIMLAFAESALMHGWQWMYLIEGAPAIVLGVVFLSTMSNGIDDAPWLDAGEKADLKAHLGRENHVRHDLSLRSLFAHPMQWTFTAIYLLIVIGVYGVNFWLPTIIRASGVSSVLTVGLVTAIPYAFGAVIMIVATRHAERTNEKRWHATVAAVLGGVGLVLSAFYADSTVLTVAFITVAIAGSMTAMALFWSFPGSMLTGVAAAAGIAAVNSIGNLGGFLGPFLLGWLSEGLGGQRAGLILLGGAMMAGGLIMGATCRNLGVRRSGPSVPEGRPTASLSAESL